MRQSYLFSRPLTLLLLARNITSAGQGKVQYFGQAKPQALEKKRHHAEDILSAALENSGHFADPITDCATAQTKPIDSFASRISIASLKKTIDLRTS